LSDKDFKVKNKLQVKGITSAGPITADSSGNIDSVPHIATQFGGTGTTTSPSSGQILYSSSGTTYAPTTLNTLDVKGASYSADAPSNPVVGQIWVESDTTSDSFDPNIIRRKSFTATAGQTTFTTDLEFIQGYEQVFFNGMLLVRNNDYTTTNNTTVVLTTAAAVNDIVEVVTITNLNSINTATTTTNTFTGRQTVSGGTNGIDIEAAALIRAKNGFRVTGNNGANEYQIGPFYNFTDFQITHSTDGFATHNPRLTIDSNGNVALSTAYTTLSGTAGNGQWRIRGKYNADTAPYQSDMITSVNWNTVTNTQDVSVNGSAYTVLGGGSNGYSGFAVYTGGNSATPAERFRIDSIGNVGIGGTSTGAMLYVLQPSTGSSPALFVRQTFDTFAGINQQNLVNRANTSAYSFLYNYSSGGGDVEQYMRGDGQSYADGSWNGGGADYAEYFEWQDGNPDNEDRRGYSVSLINDKIKIAEEGDIPFGVVSGNPSVVGDDAPIKWVGKYLKDDFGSYIRDENGYRILNPEYDEDAEYISREARSEWSTIGLMGKLRLRKGQLTGAGWIKMRDISETIEEWLVK
jgi:hypothetical protein